MAQIPFKVSARTARLIGRENIATSKGAIIELVKNAYDADSKVCIVFFDNSFSQILKIISDEEYQNFIEFGIPESEIRKLYNYHDKEFYLNENLSPETIAYFKKQMNFLSSIYIIDEGEGMTERIIREHWMTIGTDNKSNNVFTMSGRIKAGAKGIGRFALDKLGNKCEMITVFNPDCHPEDIQKESKYDGYIWKVNWEDFEGEFKTIDKVKAELSGINTDSLKTEIQKKVKNISLEKIFAQGTFKYGTVIKVSDLREYWEGFFVDEIFADLEVLVPPKESSEFRIFLYSSLLEEKYGEIEGSVCDDYDYKLTAIADNKQNIKITISRKEYDVELIPPEFFERDPMQIFPFRKKDFLDINWSIERTFAQLIPGFALKDEDDLFNSIGPFEFTFYFLKRTYSTPDANRFFYRTFISKNRKDWLEKYGGIKLFRDHFRVRPYGETKDSAFDWLGLGTRKATSPAGVAKPEGGYKVEPENIAGTIKISRLTNINFEDKSSREGLQENRTFLVLKNIIANIIGIFENDRSFIAKEMALFDNERFSSVRDREKAEEIAKRILNEVRTNRTNQTNQDIISDQESIPPTELNLLAELNAKKTEEIEQLKEEQKVLRGLASSGIVLASFSHDLSKLNGVLNSRIAKVKELFIQKINENEYLDVEDRKNPFFQLEKIRSQDIKLQNWLNFSMGATRKDKRKRKQLFLKTYFIEFKNDWDTILCERGIDLDISKVLDIDLRFFEIDFDSIFNNLLVNSIEAFKESKINRERKISVIIESNSKNIIIDYYDTGPGLSKDLINPNDIFRPLVTTKVNVITGEEEGTGLGMWIIKSIVEENDGQTKLLFPDIGFGLRMNYPIKYKRD